MKVEGIFQGQNIVSTNISDILNRLNVGDIVRAQVMDLTANELILKLFDGTTLSAASMVPIDAKPGDFIDFTVNNKANGRIFLETVKNSGTKTGTTDEIRKLLITLNLKPTNSNIELTRELKTNNFPITKESLQAIIETASRFKDIIPAKIAYLAANNINIEEKNISALNHLIDNRFKLGSKLEELVMLLSNIKENPVIEKIAQALRSYDIAKSDDTVNIMESTNSTTLKETETSNPTKDPVPVNKNQLFEKETKPGVTENIIKLINEELKNVIDSKTKSMIDEMKLPEKLTNLSVRLESEEIVLEKAVAFITSQLEKSEAAGLKNVNGFLRDLIGKLAQEKAQLNLSNKPILFIKEDSPHEIIKRSFENLYTKLDNGERKTDINVKTLYKELYEKLDMIKNSVSLSTIPGRDDISGRIDTLQNNIRFINEINNNNIYLQIPINIMNNNTTGELYVLKKGSKGKKIDPGNVTVLLSLDTRNLGQVDSLISVNLKNVSVNLRVEEEEFFDVIKENYKNLYNSLADKGYKLVALNYRVIDDSVNLLNVEKIAEKEAGSGKKTFDCRI